MQVAIPSFGVVVAQTHGGRFLSAAEDPPVIEVDFTNPEHTIPQGYLRAEVTYNLDDSEIPG